MIGTIIAFSNLFKEPFLLTTMGIGGNLFCKSCIYLNTLFCRSMLAPASSSSETTSVLPQLTANISAESPSYVMTDMCSETLMTSQKGSSHTRPPVHVRIRGGGTEFYDGGGACAE